MRGREPELMRMALADLRLLGYSTAAPEWPSPFGKKVRRLSGIDERFHALIQTRSFQHSTWRYLVGLVIPDMRRVDQVIIWFENERSLLKIPASYLRGILDEWEALGDARYSTEGRQWRVDFHLSHGFLSPQGSGGKPYDISKYFVNLPVNQLA